MIQSHSSKQIVFYHLKQSGRSGRQVKTLLTSHVTSVGINAIQDWTIRASSRTWNFSWPLDQSSQWLSHHFLISHNDNDEYADNWQNICNKCLLTCFNHFIKDLCVTFDSHLKFDLHIDKAHSILGIIRSNFIFLDKDSFLVIYKSMARSYLEHANCIWSYS